MALNAGVYGGGLMGPSVRGGRDDNFVFRNRETPRPYVRPTPTPAKPTAPPGTGGPAPVHKPTPGKPTPVKPKPKGKTTAKLSELEKALNKVWQVPTLTVPTLLTPELRQPTLQSATLNEFNVTPIEIGDLPELEAAPEQAPVTAMPDRYSAEQRKVKLAELARVKGMKGYGASMLSGGGGDMRRVAVRKGV